jgi:hypothetical protein
VTVSASIAGLTTGRTYHFRIVAMNTAGTANGSDLTFSTAAAPIVATAAGSAVATTSATLNGTVNPNGRPTSWYFEYGTTTSYGSTTPSKNAGSGTATVKVAAALTKLVTGTTYHFRLVAKSDAGTSHGSDQTFATTGVTMHASVLAVVFGQHVTLSGAVSGGQTGETVTVYAQRFGETTFRSIATVLTATGGAWSYAAKPSVQTQYEASWKTAPSSQVAVGVHPFVSLRTLKGARFSTHVAAGRSFAGRTVKLQRLSQLGQWVTVGVRKLSTGSSTIFHPTLRKGTSRLRVAISVNQAGAGYLGGVSRTLTYRRR